MPSGLSTWIQELGADDVQVRRRASAALARQPDGARRAAVSLVRATADVDGQVRECAAAALEDLGTPDPADVVPLIELLGSGSADVGYWAATLLGRLGSAAADAVRPLVVALADCDRPIVQEKAAWALGNMGLSAASARAALQESATSTNRRLARLAKQALAATYDPDVGDEVEDEDEDEEENEDEDEEEK